MYRGSQLSEGLYVSGRDVGNWFAGAAARLTNQDKSTFLKIAGAFNGLSNDKTKLAGWLVGFNQNSSWVYPTYGEKPESNLFQRMGYHLIFTKQGFSANAAEILSSDHPQSKYRKKQKP